ncbi:fructosamine kinase family protein [Longispora albida]|uniref:fructosamine kinase family protein n=1 Tax=Longispora albida TaxID=203523 RepID=UPI0004777942|nr:fructosamine kinase family protein [Longispora albida]
MDLEYLRANPHLLLTFLAHQRLRTTPVSGGSICTAERITLDDGSDLLLKTWPGGVSAAPTQDTIPPPPGFFAAEARGLRWLREAAGHTRQHGARIPELIAATDDLLLMEWIEHGQPTLAAAERLGHELATTHRAGASHFGAAEDGYLGFLPLDNTPGDSWADWYRAHRLAPLVRLSVDNGGLTAEEGTQIERIRIEVPDEPPARLHGDLWPGNVVWGLRDRAWLIDPAAHGGHRETDLATLHLFGGAPYLPRILEAYDETWPLEPGWKERVPLHQLYLLLAHTALFGSRYRSAVLRAAGHYL